MKNSLIKITLFIIGFVCVERFCHRITEGFRPHKICSDLPFNTAYETPLEIEGIGAYFSHPFYFLSSGGQCYAFISEDKQTILKVFKHHHMRPQSYLNRIYLPYFLKPLRAKIIAERKERLETIFSSFKLSYDRFKEHTGLLYLHLNKTSLFHQKVILVDSIGIKHSFDLDTLEFALQKTATLAYPTIEQHMKGGNAQAAKRCLQSLIELIVARSKAGIGDRDPIVKRNFGFIGEKAVEIDLGSFYEDPFLKQPLAYKRELFCETIKLKSWVRKRYPELSPFLEQTIQCAIEAQ